MTPSRVRAQILERCHHVCERCGCARATVVHHVMRRSQFGADEPENLVGLCSPCHSGIHEHPADSYRDGWLRKGVQNVHKGLSSGDATEH
jgi:5-methylcytosine-specific restriction endonuclease McrA